MLLGSHTRPLASLSPTPTPFDACYAGYASSEFRFRSTDSLPADYSTESQTFYRSIMTADDTIKCRCANLGMTGQLQTSSGPSGWFSKSRGLLPWVPEVFLACSGNRASKVSGTQGRGLSASGSFLSFPPPPRSFTCAIFRAAFDSRSSFFAPKPHGNACYAG